MNNILEKAKGKMGCPSCNGLGVVEFMGQKIFCESCHGRDGIVALWATVDGYVAKMEKNDTKKKKANADRRSNHENKKPIS